VWVYEWEIKRQWAKQKKSCLNLRKNIFTVRVTEHHRRFLRKVVESPSLEVLKTQQDMVLSNLL